MNLETSVAYSFVPEKAVSRPFKAQAIALCLLAGPLLFPCRSGKLREKIFSRLALNRKVLSDQNLARGFPVESKARQGNCRETRKPSDRRLAPTDQPSY